MKVTARLKAVFCCAAAIAGACLTPLTAAAQTTPSQSTFFSTAAEESYSTYQMAGDGDLWPGCWADDGNVYVANGDGKNFGSTFYAMAVGRISGAAQSLTGTFLSGDAGKNYAGSPYTDKPTGMLCLGNNLYLAYQNLNENTFEDAPAASIIMSSDHGSTWSSNPANPMFGVPGNVQDPTAYKFTTIFFLDFGQNSANAIDGYVYVYGLDNNWRDQTAVYLARVPQSSVLDRSTWQFFAGMNGNTPNWTSDITQKVAVLTDQRDLYANMFSNGCPAHQKVIAQGGATYDAPLQRYIMVSWGCATHEFYDAPQPWGPWTHFLSKDFGPLRLAQNRGQYGISIPSKFISSDGLTLYVQSNVCCSGDSYTYSLRKLYLSLATNSSPGNSYSSTSLAAAPGTRATSKSTHFGTLCGYNCSDAIASATSGRSEDDWDEENKPADGVESYWGYIWPQVYNLNQVTYTTGTMFPDGGWFASNLRVQVRQNFRWIDVTDGTVTPQYPYSNEAGSQTTYTFNFSDTWGDGVRIVGMPGGTSYFTSINNLQVYYSDGSVSGTPGFNLQLTPDSLTVTKGESGTAALNLVPVNGFNQAVTFACSGLPSEATCGFSPTTVTLDGSTISAVKVTIATTTSSASSAHRVSPWPLVGVNVLSIIFLLPWRRRAKRLLTPGRALVLGMVLTMGCLATSCGGGHGATPPSDPGTPIGSSLVTITAMSGTGSSQITQTAQLTLKVQ